MFPSAGNFGYGNWGYGLLSSYGTLSLTAQSPVQVFVEPLTVAEVKSYLNIPERSPVDAEEDDTIAGFISAAREIAEIYQGRDLVKKQWDLVVDYFLTYSIRLRAPLVSVDLLQYTDKTGIVKTLTAGTDFFVDTHKQPGIVTPVYNTVWPSFVAQPSSSVLLRFTSGYSAADGFWNEAGKRLKVGMKLLISEWYNNRLPFERNGTIAEHLGGVTALLSYGQLDRHH